MPVLLESRNRHCVIKPRIDPQGTAACCREYSEETTRRDGRWRQSRWPRCRPAIWFLSIDRHGRTMRPVATTGSRTFPPVPAVQPVMVAATSPHSFSHGKRNCIDGATQLRIYPWVKTLSMACRFRRPGTFLLILRTPKKENIISGPKMTKGNFGDGHVAVLALVEHTKTSSQMSSNLAVNRRSI